MTPRIGGCVNIRPVHDTCDLLSCVYNAYAKYTYVYIYLFSSVAILASELPQLAFAKLYIAGVALSLSCSRSRIHSDPSRNEHICCPAHLLSTLSPCLRRWRPSTSRCASLRRKTARCTSRSSRSAKLAQLQKCQCRCQSASMASEMSRVHVFNIA